MSVLLHILALWMLVVALPLFDVLGRSPEFFVAHRTRPADIWLFTALLSLVVPALVYGLVRASSLISSRLTRLLTGVFVGTMAAAMALQAGKQIADLEVVPAFAAAAITAVSAFYLYGRYPGVRWTMTLLSPVILLVPAMFLWQPGVRSQLSATAVQPVDLDMVEAPPVVVMVFDQLPLASLLDVDLQIDGRQYPNFAALSREATWFRNASAVSGFTGWALPAIMSGQRPDPARTPAAADYPENLFTLLGARYRLEVFEPMTSLCPETLCEGMPPSMPRILQDVAIVFLHLVAPGRLAAQLPPVTQTWRDFAAADSAGERWRAERRGSRGPAVEAFIEHLGRESDGRTPLLAYAHALIPHEPFVYLPSGQLATTRPTAPGYQPDGTWSEDVWAVGHTYRRHLAQVGYADTLLGALMDRLRTIGLYDDALIVVAADHGASFRLGHSVRALTREAPADIMAIPLLIKRPGQRTGSVDDSNVETVDVLPTILGALGALAPDSVEGADVFAPGWTPRPTKSFARDGAGASVEVDDNLLPSLAEAVRWKIDLLGEAGSPFTPDAGRYTSLVGRALSDVPTRPESDVEVTVDVPGLFASVDPAGNFVPAHVSGTARRQGTEGAAPTLAIALNGVIRAIARPFAEPVEGRTDTWATLLDPTLFVRGPNRVEVLAIADQPDGTVVLERAWEPAADASPVENLILDGIAWLQGVTTTGFHDLESPNRIPFRWTDGAAQLIVPVTPDATPSTLVVDVVMGSRNSHIEITANGCLLADEPITAPWSKRFPIDTCVAGTDLLTIDIRSDTFVPSGADQRTLGVAIARIELH